MLVNNLLAALCYVSIAWIISAVLRRADVIDAFWGPGFVLIGWLSYAARQNDASLFVQILLLATTIWGLRLGLYLTIRWWGEPHEDRRYAAMRAAGSSKWWLRSLVTVFFFQAAIMWVVSLPLQFGLASSSTSAAGWFWAGLACWAIGLLFEAVGDWQLSRFLANPDNADKVLNTGLWHYTRHPNYFGDFLVWWGLFTMSAVCGAPLWTAVGPLIMSVCLMKFSGVGILEKTIHSRRPGYAQYVQSTSTFFPTIPRRVSQS